MPNKGAGMGSHNSSSANLLITKLTAPVYPLKIVQRARLTNCLREGMRHRLTLIVAPAGYGKTTLLNEWGKTSSKIGWPVGWFSLDQGDNEPRRFWAYFLKALQTANPEIAFDFSDNNDAFYREMFGELINRIAENHKHFSLVLDDYHVIESQNIYADLAYWIEHMPEHMHLVIASRTAPKLPIAQYRAKNQLFEIGTRDLMFNLVEGATFFREVMTINVDAEDLSTLIRLTEGWIAGLQLAAFSMKNHPNIKQFIADFDGSQRHIFDYLTEVALVQQEQALQDFLIKTSILDELSAPLCDFLLNIVDSQEKLEFLEQSNAFIAPMDEKREWYRFHPLFTDLLRARLKRMDSRVVQQLHKQACAWYLENGFPEKLIPHALAAGDLELAATVIEACSQQALLDGNLTGVIHWINSLPEEIIRERPKLGLFAAEANYLLGRLEKVELSLQQVKSSLNYARENSDQREIKGQIRQEFEMIRIAVECIQEDFGQGILQGSEALNELPRNTPLYGLMNHYMGYAFDAQGDLDSAAQAFAQAGDFALHHNIPNKYVLSQCELARIRKSQGRLKDAKYEFYCASEYVHHTRLDTDFYYLASAGLADIYCEWNDLEAAEQFIQEVTSFLTKVDIKDLNWLFPVVVCTSLSRCLLCKGETQRAAEYFDRSLQALDNYIFLPHRFSDIIDTQARIWLKQENYEAADQWVEQKASVLERKGKLTLADKTAMARIYISTGKPKQAARLLEMIENQARETGRGSRLIEILILKAIAMHMLNQKRVALEELNTALVFAEPEGFIRLFTENGDKIRPSLFELRALMQKSPGHFEKMPSERYLDQIISGIDFPQNPVQVNKPQNVQKPVATSLYIDPLTERELDVLKQLLEGYSSREISKNLVITVNTVKVHIRNIYQKLDVNNRKDAAERAIELSLISK